MGGCNSNCHSEVWAENARRKLQGFNVTPKLEWAHRRAKKFSGIGGSEIRTKGKRRIPTAFKLANSGKILPGFLESHEQAGNHPLLLSDASQSRMGFVKDMREGKVYLKDYDDYLEIYRAHGSGLKVVCISHFPDNI